MSRRRSLWLVPVTLLAATTLVAAPALAQDPEKLVIGFVPSVEAGALVEDIQPLAELPLASVGHPRRGLRLERLRGPRDGHGDRAGADRGPAALRPGPGRGPCRRGGHPAVRPLRQHDVSHPVHDHRCRQVLRRRAGHERAPGRRRDGPGAELQRHGRAFDESPEGPIGLEALQAVEPGTPVSFVEQTSASGYIFPATIFATHGHRPRDRHRGRSSRAGMTPRSSPSATARPRSASASTTPARMPSPTATCPARWSSSPTVRRSPTTAWPSPATSPRAPGVHQAGAPRLRRHRGGRGRPRLDLQHHGVRRAEPRFAPDRP